MGTAPSPERSEQIRTRFQEVVALAPEAQADYLDRLRGQDADLHSEVEALLAAHERADELLQPLDRQLPWHLSSPGEEPDDPLLGQQISHYRILEKLGGGGMGVVYQARDTRLDRLVALKFLPPHLVLEEEAKRRFIREARAASALDHPHICTLYEIGETEQGQLFLALAYYPGETLKKKIAQGPLPIAEALGYTAQVADALAAAHEAGIVHRDIKPANVLVTTKGVAKLVDFGIAKLQGEELTRTGVTLGTAAYMSPEQARGEAVDHRTDLWSLGVVLYELLTGVRPFRGEAPEAVVYGIRHDEPVPVETLRPEIPAGLRRIIGQCLEKDPAARYQRAEELLSDLRALEDGETVPERAGRKHPRPRSWALVYGGVALLVVSAAAAVGLLGRNGAPDGLDSIAVLPVVNLSGNPEQEYFADGMTDLLINHLSRISGFDRVISRTSVMRYKNAQKSLGEIGRELGVDVLVEASMLREGESVRINVGLIEAATERTLWSESFERAVRDVLTLQREVALAITRQIEITLTPQDRARLADAPRVDPEAFDLYLKGTQARYVQLPDANRQALEYFEQAIARDSTYAPAYAGLASVRFFSDDPAEARRIAEIAIELDPGLAEPHVVLGLLRQQYDWDWEGAEEAFRHAIRLDPGHAEAHHELSMHLMRLRRFDEALREAQHTLYLAPTSARFQHGLGEVLLFSGRYDEALVATERTLALDPNQVRAYWLRGIAYTQQGRYEDAIVAWRTAIPLLTLDSARGNLGYVYAVAGRREEALTLLEELKARWGNGSDVERGTTYGIALIHAGLGEREQALAWLERAPRIWLAYVAIDPSLRSLHAEPRFQALLKRVGLDG